MRVMPDRTQYIIGVVVWLAAAGLAAWAVMTLTLFQE